ncbi:MAG: carboxylesterase/lipase family protein [Cellulomonadaceae bacterium]|nr:carboxylesterase/lipase family protein [Cellulomonadaceae bacterium]
MSAPEQPIVQTSSGAVRGVWRHGPAGSSAAFLGVPFAMAPVGALRFAAPVPREPWAGVRDASTYGPTAQKAPLAEVTTIPEPSTPGDDVLNLCVFTPCPGDDLARLPVLVWIHGGGFIAGCQNSPWYDGAAFNRDGVVTVSLGYRLGIEGWLHVDGAPDNRGALDWVAGLEWVRHNIAAFGGDPDRVTVAGQSAGGGAVLTLLGIPGATGLFHGALAISGATGTASSTAAAEAVAARFTEITGWPATAQALADVGGEELHAAAVELTSSGATGLGLAPWVDGTVITQAPADAVANGPGRGVPLVLGFTAHEFGDGDRQVVTDAVFRRPGLTLAELRARDADAHGGAATWLYQFEWRSTAPATGGIAFHCLDLPFGWDCLAAERVEAATGAHPPQHLADAVHGAWVRFVRDADPGWPPYRSGSRTTRVWDDPVADVADRLRELREA